MMLFQYCKRSGFGSWWAVPGGIEIYYYNGRRGHCQKSSWWSICKNSGPYLITKCEAVPRKRCIRNSLKAIWWTGQSHSLDKPPFPGVTLHASETRSSSHQERKRCASITSHGYGALYQKRRHCLSYMQHISCLKRETHKIISGSQGKQVSMTSIWSCPPLGMTFYTSLASVVL